MEMPNRTQQSDLFWSAIDWALLQRERDELLNGELFYTRKEAIS
jgi:hypothetical protein